MAALRLFRYVPELDAFLVTQQYERLADYLGLIEWNPVVWIGRLFVLDNDYGEHWFDNWDERENALERAAALGIDAYRLMFVNPECFVNGADGPCHSPDFRRRFWTDVLKSLELSYELLFDEARQMNEVTREVAPDEYIPDLERRIRRIQAALARNSSPT